MTINEAMVYLKARAKSCGYTDKMFSAFEHEIQELLYRLDDWSVADVDGIFDEVF